MEYYIIALIVPLFIIGIYLPWIRKGSYRALTITNIFITISLAAYIFFIYKSFMNSVNPSRTMLLTFPLILGSLIETYFLFKKHYQRLHQLNKFILISALPYFGVVVFDKTRVVGDLVKYSDPEGVMIFFYSIIVTTILQGILLYVTFALYRKINPNAKLAYKLNTSRFDNGLFARFDKTIFGNNNAPFTLEHLLEKEGELESISWKDTCKSLLKYIFVILMLYFYGYIIFILT